MEHPLTGGGARRAAVVPAVALALLSLVSAAACGGPAAAPPEAGQATGRTRQGERSEMTLRVGLEIERDVIFFQESPVVTVTVTNAGPEPVPFMDPVMNPDSPAFRLIDLQTGAETRIRHDGDPAGPRPQPLAPGRPYHYSFRLSERVEIPQPGRYELSALLPLAGGAGEVESPGVRLQVLPVTVRHLTVTPAALPSSTIQYAASVNIDADPPELVLHLLQTAGGPGVPELRRVAQATMRSQPVLSQPPSRGTNGAPWIGWVEGDAVHFTNYDLIEGPTAVTSWPDAAPELDLVAPILARAQGESAARPDAAALVLSGESGRDRSQLQVLELRPGAAPVPGERGALAGPRPAWTAAHARSDGARWLLYAQQGETLSLGAVRWPGPGAAEPAVTLGTWPSRLVAAGSAVDESDAFVGALLLITEEQGTRRLELLPWRLDVRGGFSVGERQDLGWTFDRKIAHAAVFVSPGGLATVELRDGEDRNAVWSGKGPLQPAPGALARSPLPLAVAYAGLDTPLWVAGELKRGLSLRSLDGSPLHHH